MENVGPVKWNCPLTFTIDGDVENPQVIEDAFNYIEKVTRWHFVKSPFAHNLEHLRFVDNKNERKCYSENVGVEVAGK